MNPSDPKNSPKGKLRSQRTSSAVVPPVKKPLEKEPLGDGKSRVGVVIPWPSPKITSQDKALEEGWILVGEVGKPHGVKGAFFVRTVDRRSSLTGTSLFLCEVPGGFAEVKAQKNLTSAGEPVLAFDFLISRDATELACGKKIFVNRAHIKTKEDEYVVADLLGCKVEAEGKGIIGTVTQVMSFGAQNNIEITRLDGSTVLFPFLEGFVLGVQLAEKKVSISWIPEFLED